MFKLGLTGGIGSGKSLVAKMLAERGASVIDTDQISHQLTLPGGKAIQGIQEVFGDEMIDDTGAMDRQKMRERVFADPSAREQLQAILHPLINQSVEDEANRAKGIYLVFEVPLLTESKTWRNRVDRICVVDCDRATQIRRVQSRNGLPLETIEHILEVQASREQRLALADDVILNDNTVTIPLLTEQVDKLHTVWCNLAQRKKV
jgi:dephospho-CoA kinase